MPQSVRRTVLALLVFANLLTLPDARAGFVIEIANTTDHSQALSDLIAFSADGERDPIVEFDTPDDPTIPARETRRFTSKLDDVSRIFVSQRINDKEIESVALKVTNAPKVVPLLDDPLGIMPLYLILDFDLLSGAIPSVGDLLEFSNGLNPGLQGWFVGTNADLMTGEVSEPFTGVAEVVSTAFSIALISVPEPSSLSLLATFLLYLSIVGRLHALPVGRKGGWIRPMELTC